MRVPMYNIYIIYYVPTYSIIGAHAKSPAEYTLSYDVVVEGVCFYYGGAV